MGDLDLPNHQRHGITTKAVGKPTTFAMMEMLAVLLFTSGCNLQASALM